MADIRVSIGPLHSVVDEYAKLLFHTASELTPFMTSIAHEQGLNPEPGARGFVFNGDLALVIQSLDIGTRPSNLR